MVHFRRVFAKVLSLCTILMSYNQSPVIVTWPYSGVDPTYQIKGRVYPKINSIEYGSSFYMAYRRHGYSRKTPDSILFRVILSVGAWINFSFGRPKKVAKIKHLTKNVIRNHCIRIYRRFTTVPGRLGTFALNNYRHPCFFELKNETSKSWGSSTIFGSFIAAR